MQTGANGQCSGQFFTIFGCQSDRFLLLYLQQKALGIQAPLVYIAGLVQILELSKRKQSSFEFAANTNRTSNDFNFLQGHFLKLQKLYHQKSGGGNRNAGVSVANAANAATATATADSFKSFHWSPRLLPREDQRHLIEKDFARKLNEMEKRANAVATELILNEADNKITIHGQSTRRNEGSLSRKKKKKRQNNKSERKENNDIYKRDERDFNNGTETLQELMNMKIQNNTTDGDDDCNQAWVEVKKKGGKEHESQNMEELHMKMNSYDAINHSLDVATAVSDEFIDQGDSEVDNEVDGDSVSTSTRKGNNDLSVSDTSKGEIHQEPISNPRQGAEVHEHGNIHNNDDETSLLKKRIQELELEILQKDTQLKEEQQKNMKMLREEKERFSDQMRAVQMRLYISETRLKNYEDALKNHVEAVSNSVSSAYSYTTPSIPDHDGHTTSQSISSVLIKNRLNED